MEVVVGRRGRKNKKERKNIKGLKGFGSRVSDSFYYFLTRLNGRIDQFMTRRRHAHTQS